MIGILRVATLRQTIKRDLKLLKTLGFSLVQATGPRRRAAVAIHAPKIGDLRRLRNQLVDLVNPTNNKVIGKVAMGPKAIIG